MQPRFESPIVGVFERLPFALKFGLLLLGPDGTVGGLDCIVGRIYIGPDKKRYIRLSIYSTLQIHLLFCAAERVVSQYGPYRLIQLRN